jgi:uncharacterized coiled-coil protein SlyX
MDEATAKAINAISRQLAQQQREIETLKYKVAILERDKYERIGE